MFSVSWSEVVHYNNDWLSRSKVISRAAMVVILVLMPSHLQWQPLRWTGLLGPHSPSRGCGLRGVWSQQRKEQWVQGLSILRDLVPRGELIHSE